MPWLTKLHFITHAAASRPEWTTVSSGMYHGKLFVLKEPGYPVPEGCQNVWRAFLMKDEYDETIWVLQAKKVATTRSGKPTPDIRVVAANLRMSLAGLARLIGVHENTMQTWVRRRDPVDPSGPALCLLRLLERHPEIAKKIEATTAIEAP